ncbi:MAG: adenylyl-sulfate kinase [Gemmatimonadota bacterium]
MSRSSNVFWHENHVSRADREAEQGHPSVVVWFTGLSGSGKSTLANELDWRLMERGIHSYVLDGDNIRHGLNGDLGFSPADRSENIRRIGEVARLFLDAGTIVLTAFISPYRADRDRVRGLMERDSDFLEVYVKTPLEVCEERDPKGLYRRARAGEIPDFTGVSAPYEAPTAPEITLDTSHEDVSACVDALIDALVDRGYIPGERTR